MIKIAEELEKKLEEKDLNRLQLKGSIEGKVLTPFEFEGDRFYDVFVRLKAVAGDNYEYDKLDSYGDEILVAEAHFKIVPSAFKDGEENQYDMLDEMDASDGDLYEVGCALHIDDLDEMSEEIYSELIGGDLAYLETLRVHKNLRGLGIGTEMLKLIPEALKNILNQDIRLIALAAAPYELCCDRDSEMWIKAQKNLAKWYKTNGFVFAGENEVYYKIQ